jgi:dienelactone hydrolase
MQRAIGIVVAFFLFAGSRPAGAAALSFDAGSVGPPGSNARAEIWLPTGTGPFPAVVVLHGCDGIGRHYRIWARDLAAWGYVALLVDSFRPRGIASVCNHGSDVPPLLQAEDGLAAASYLRSLPNVRRDRIGVIGFSHGGWAVLKAVLSGTLPAAQAPPFAAAVAFYPGCELPSSPLATDTLILIGDADDWTPARRCIRWRDAADAAGHALELKIYPGARHGFDAPAPLHQFAGHYVGRDPAAAADAVAAARAFLAARLGP